MNPQERQLVAELFDRLASLEPEPRDPDAERVIAEGFRRAPHGGYALVQTVLVQDEALKRANARIEELQAMGADEAPRQGGGFLDNMRDALLGLRRFEEFTGSLGMARNVLTDRLNGLVEHGIFERVPYQQRPPRHEYRLTAKGLDLYPVLVGLMQWGDTYAGGPDGPPVVLQHRDCGEAVQLQLTCEAGHVLESARDVAPVPGPGARKIA